jgi:hypothetical protein
MIAQAVKPVRREAPMAYAATRSDESARPGEQRGGIDPSREEAGDEDHGCEREQHELLRCARPMEDDGQDLSGPAQPCREHVLPPKERGERQEEDHQRAGEVERQQQASDLRIETGRHLDLPTEEDVKQPENEVHDSADGEKRSGHARRTGRTRRRRTLPPRRGQGLSATRAVSRSRSARRPAGRTGRRSPESPTSCATRGPARPCSWLPCGRRQSARAALPGSAREPPSESRRRHSPVR